MTNGVREHAPPVMMSAAEDAFFKALSVKVADLVAAEAKAAGFGPRASSAGAMACLRAVAVALWWSVPEAMRSDAYLRGRMKACADVATDNLMLELGMGRRQ